MQLQNRPTISDATTGGIRSHVCRICPKRNKNKETMGSGTDQSGILVDQATAHIPPRGFNEKGFKTATSNVYNDTHRLPLNKNGNCFPEDAMLMDFPQAIKRRRLDQLHNANAIQYVSELTPPQVQAIKRKNANKKTQLLNINKEARLLRRRLAVEEQDTDQESDEDLRDLP